MRPCPPGPSSSAARAAPAATCPRPHRRSLRRHPPAHGRRHRACPHRHGRRPRPARSPASGCPTRPEIAARPRGRRDDGAPGARLAVRRRRAASAGAAATAAPWWPPSPPRRGPGDRGVRRRRRPTCTSSSTSGWCSSAASPTWRPSTPATTTLAALAALHRRDERRARPGPTTTAPTCASTARSSPPAATRRRRPRWRASPSASTATTCRTPSSTCGAPTTSTASSSRRCRDHDPLAAVDVTRRHIEVLHETMFMALIEKRERRRTADRETPRDERRRGPGRASPSACEAAGVRWVVCSAMVDMGGVTRVKCMPGAPACLRRCAPARARRRTGSPRSPTASSPCRSPSAAPSATCGSIPDLGALTRLAATPGWAWVPADQYTQEGEPTPAASAASSSAWSSAAPRPASRRRWPSSSSGSPRASADPHQPRTTTGPSFSANAWRAACPLVEELLNALERAGACRSSASTPSARPGSSRSR